jgi:hypothetical protein
MGSESVPIDNHRARIIIVVLAIAINLLVLINNFLHDPGIGYDAQDHLDYIYVLPYRLPTPDDTREFFSAPLPYLIPAITNVTGRELFKIGDTEYINGRTAQLVNLLLSIWITLLVLKISSLIAPGNDHFKITSLALIGILPVYYKTFAQVRGEPYVVFFTLLLVYQIVARLKQVDFNPWRSGIVVGITMGGLALSRQWGMLVLPAAAVLIYPISIWNKDAGRRYLKMMAAGIAVAMLAAGWFYIHLLNNYGTVTAFNREERKFSFANQPISFYKNTGLGNFLLFRAPTRPVFNNLLIPTFYSEIWGDYWGFFVFIKDQVPFYGMYANQARINPYLGRVNLVSLFPTFLLLAGLWTGLRYTIDFLMKKKLGIRPLALVFMSLIILSSAAGYFWFLIKYPEIPRGTTIKATYMLHALSLLPFLAAEFLDRIQAAKPRLYFTTLGFCALVFLHNLPAMITRYWWLLK